MAFTACSKHGKYEEKVSYMSSCRGDMWNSLKAVRIVQCPLLSVQYYTGEE